MISQFFQHLTLLTDEREKETKEQDIRTEQEIDKETPTLSTEEV